MSGSLQDQLMNMGLANKKQAKKANADKRKESKKAKNTKKSGTAGELQVLESQTEVARKEQVERDKALNLQRQEEKTKRAEEAEKIRTSSRHNQNHDLTEQCL